MKRIIAGLVLAGIAFGAMADMNHFGGFKPEQQMIDDTIGHVEAQRRADHANFGGHAEKAEALLRQAKEELTAAEEFRAHH